MNSIEKLKAYQDGQKIVNDVENELDKMVDAFWTLSFQIAVAIGIIRTWNMKARLPKVLYPRLSICV